MADDDGIVWDKPLVSPSTVRAPDKDGIVWDNPISPEGGDDKTGFLAAFGSGVQGGLGSAALAYQAAYPYLSGTGMASKKAEAELDQYRAEKAAQAKAALPAGVTPFTGEGSGDFFRALRENAGASLPYAIPGVLGAIAGGPLGAGLATYPLVAGSNLEAQIDNYGYVKDPGTAFAAAVPQTAAEVAFGMLPIAKIFRGGIGEVVAKATANPLSKFSFGVGKQMLGEGSTEVFQQSLERWQAGLPVGNDDAKAAYLESFVAGAVLGSVPGAVEGGLDAYADKKANAKKILEDRTLLDAVNELKNSQSEEIRARALELQNQINESRRLLLAPPPKTIGGKEFGGEDIVDVATKNPDLVPGWKTILESPSIQTVDQLRVALLAAAGQPPKPNIRGQRYDLDALAASGAQSDVAEMLRRQQESMVPPATTEQMAAGVNSPFAGLSDDQIVAQAEQNRGQNPELDAILDQPIGNVQKAAAIVAKYQESYGPEYETLAGISDLPITSPYTAPTLAGPNQLTFLQQQQQEQQDALERMRVARQEAQAALLAAASETGLIRGRTDEGTGGAGQAAMDLAAQPPLYGNVPYEGPNDARVTNYIRNLPPNTPPSVALMTSELGLTVAEARDAISGNTGQNRLLVMRMGVPTTRPKRGPGAPDTTASSPRGAATNIEDMTGTRNTSGSETAGEGVTIDRSEESLPLTDQDRVDDFIDGLTGGQDFTPKQAQVATRASGPKAVSFSKINARIQQLIDEGRVIPFGNGFKRVATDDDARRMIFDHPAFEPLNVTDIARDTGLPYGDVLDIARRYVRDASASETTRGLTQQSDNLLTETATPGVFVRTGAKAPSLPAGNRKTQRSVAGDEKPMTNLARVLAEAAEKNGEAQPSPAAPQAEATSPEEDIAPTPRLGGKTRLEDLGGTAETTQQAPPAGGAAPQQEAPQGASGPSAGTNAYASSNKERLAKSRKVVAEKLRQLRASGKAGAEVANKISQLLKDPNFDAEQIIRAFGVADALSKTFGGTDANPRVEFHRELFLEDEETKKRIVVAGEAAAADAGVRGFIKISLSKDLSSARTRDTAFHEGFHFLQDMINEYDPKTAEFLFGKRIGSDPNNGRGIYSGGAFRDGMTLADIDPSIKRVLQNAVPQKGGPSYWDILKRRYDGSESIRSDFADQREAVAYVFGALADAQNNGHQLGGLKPAFRRFLNFLTQFAQNLRNVFRGYGYTNTNQILSEFAAGKKQKGYGRDIEGDFSGSTGDRQSQRAIDEDLKAAKSQGVDTSNIPEVRKAGELQRFATDFNKKMSERTQEVRAKIRQLREEGKLPFDIGTKFTTEQSRSSGQPPYTVTGYTVGKTMDEYGYRVDQGSPNDENYTQTSIDVSNPRIDKKYKEEYGMPDFDRQKIVDGFRVLGGPMRTVKPQRAIAGDKEAVPEGTTKVGINADIRRLIDLFGPKMYSSGMAHVTAKELLQNSFDGVKSAYASGVLYAGEGNIGFVSDKESRSILITDNGAGMSPETVRDAFLTLAGTNKEGLSAGEASGGFGVAKMAFIFGNKRLILNTVKDGVRTTLDTNGEELLNGAADINVEPTYDAPGTSVLITVPESYTTDNGSEEKIDFPSYTGGFEIFEKPLLGDVAIYESDSIPDVQDFNPDELRDYSRNLISIMEAHEGDDRYTQGFWRTKKGRFSELEDTPLMTTARFPWGDIQIYYGNEKQKWSSSASVLSSGLYQFNKSIPKIGSMYEKIPYNVILNVRPRVKAESSEYPFNKQREDFNKKIEKDIAALIRYLGKIAWNRDALDVGSNFADIKTIRNVSFFTPEEILNDRPIAEFLVETGDPDLRQHIPKAKKQDLSAEFVDVRDGKVTGNGKELAAEDEKSEEKDENAQLDLKKYLIPSDLVPSGPVLHNNLDVDPIEEAARRTGEDPLLLRYYSYRLASIFYNFAQELGKHPNHFHWNAVGHPVGISFDKEYHGVHVKVPFKGMFVNPASAKGDSVKAIAASFLHTMMHEATHDVAGGHNEKFTMSLGDLYSYIEDVAPDLIDKTTDDLRTLVREYETQFKALRGVLNASDVKNVESDEGRTGQRIGGRDQGDTGNASRSGSSAERGRGDAGGNNAGRRGREGGEGLRRGAGEAGGVGNKAQRAFVGEKAASWDPALQKAAERLEREGSDWKNVYWKTGLHRGKKDGKWRMEIPDVGAEIDDNIVRYLINDTSNATAVKLSDVYDHPDIYREYPFLRDIEFSVLPPSKDTNVSGNADPYRNKIGVAIDYLEHHLLGSKAKYPDVVKKILTHEIQHFIQNHEGFTYGSSEEQILDDAEKKSASLKENADDTFRSKVEDVVDEINKNTNRYLFNDIRKKYPDLRINLEDNFKDPLKDPVLYSVSGSSASPIKGDRADKILAEIKAHPDMAKVEAVQDAYTRALNIYNNIVFTIHDEISSLTPEELKIRYRAVYGERESRDTEGRLALKTKGERAGTLPGEMDYHADITPDRDEVFDAALYRDIEDGSFLDPESAELKKISRSISSSTMLGKLTNAFKPQRSIAGDDEPGIASEMSKDLERIREAGGRRTFITTGKALNRMADIISTKFDPKGTLPHKDLLRVMMNMANGNIKIIEEKANERRLIIDSGTKEQRAEIYKYLTTKGAVLPSDMPERLRDAAKGAKADIINVGRQIVDKGILTKEKIAANEGQYLPRMYMQYLKDAAGFGTGSYRLSKQDYTKKKQDIPEDIRTAKGEILEPGFPYMKAAVLPARDAAIIDFLSDVANTKGTGWVAENSVVEWRGTKVSPFWLSEQMQDIRDNMLYEKDPARLAAMKKVADQMQTIIDKTDMRGDAGENYERLPNTARYGALRGMAVRKEIHEAVVGMGSYAGDMSDFERILGRGVNFWKLTKTVFNPASHFRQIYSNMIVADLSGISMPMIPVRMVQAIGDILGDKGAWKIAKENGITATGMVDYEIRQALDDLKVIAKATPAGKILSAIPINEWSKKWLRRINPVNLYQWEDYIFKVIKIKDEMEKYEKRLGPAKDAKEQRLRESAAVLEANEWFMDYSDVHRGIKRARESFYGAPFITYQYKIAPRIAETVLKRPWRMAPYIGLYWAMPALAASMMDLDDDDLERLKKSMKEYLRLNPSALPLPWIDERRNFQFLDVGYLFPWSYMTNLANTMYQSATGNATPTDIVKATGALGNPILTGLTAALTNIDTFTGKEIINKYDTTGDKVKDFLGYVWGQLAPPFITNYGPIGGPIADWFSGNRGDIDRKGNPRRSTSQLMAQFFGFNIYPVNPEQQFAQNVMLMENDIKRAQANLTQELNNKTLSAENRRALIDKRMPDIKRRMQKMQEYIRDARPTERLRNR